MESGYVLIPKIAQAHLAGERIGRLYLWPDRPSPPVETTACRLQAPVKPRCRFDPNSRPGDRSGSGRGRSVLLLAWVISPLRAVGDGREIGTGWSRCGFPPHRA